MNFTTTIIFIGRGQKRLTEAVFITASDLINDLFPKAVCFPPPLIKQKKKKINRQAQRAHPRTWSGVREPPPRLGRQGAAASALGGRTSPPLLWEGGRCCRCARGGALGAVVRDESGEGAVVREREEWERVTTWKMQSPNTKPLEMLQVNTFSLHP